MKLNKNRPLLLDGAMGTILAKSLPTKLSNLDEANILYPRLVERIHRMYAEAGADIIKTNTFNNSSFTKEAVILARSSINPKTQMIAGVIGPTFYETKIEAIIQSFNEASVDLILLETMTSLKDTKEYLKEITKNSKFPIMVSITIDKDGKALSGESPSIFLKEISSFNIFSFGFNCSFGSHSISKALSALENPKNIRVSAHPNLGLPDAQESELDFLNQVNDWIKNKKVTIIGGCCGTTPELIGKIKKLIP